MTGMETLQAKLKSRANETTKRIIDKALLELPEFESARISVEADGTKIVRASVRRNDIFAALREAMTETLFPKVLEEMTEDLLSTVKKVRELTGDGR